MEAAGRQQSYHDAHARTHTFKEGDTVWFYRPSSLKKGVTSKLAYKWSGPYTIDTVLGDVTYTLKDAEGHKVPGTAHARHLYKQLEPVKRSLPEQTVGRSSKRSNL